MRVSTLLACIACCLTLLYNNPSLLAQDFRWATQVPATYFSESRAMAVDADGNVIIVGIFEGSTDLDPGPGVYNVTTSVAQQWNTFIQKLDSNGNFLWGGTLASPDRNAPMCVQTDANGNIYILG